MKKKIQSVYVEFLDHVSSSAWMNSDELKDHKAMTVYAHGWLVAENELEIKVSGQVTEDGDVGDTMAILKPTIIKLVKLDISKQIADHTTDVNNTTFVVKSHKKTKKHRQHS
jgi:hypothetical protein